MRLIHIDEYDYHTMQLALPIYDRFKRVLLAAGRSIHPKYLEKIKDMKISYLMVEDAISKGITIEDMLDMPTWLDAAANVKALYDQAKQTQKIDVSLLNKTAARLMTEVRHRQAIFLIPSTAIDHELRPYAHAVNVTLLCLQMAKKLRVNDLRMRDLACGALLHDIGKVAAEHVKDHPQQGFELLRKNREISLLAAHVAFQHHEHADGSGYPRGITGRQMHLFAQICAVANAYENLIAVKRILPHEATEMIMAQNETVFVPAVVEAFFKAIPSYPPGFKVMLSDGRAAIVTKITSHMHRPVVRCLESGEEIALADHPTLLITDVLA
jgi:putative nucleotidyltransferase with HDIG domain